MMSRNQHPRAGTRSSSAADRRSGRLLLLMAFATAPLLALGCGIAGDASSWTAEDRDTIQHLITAIGEVQEVTRLRNRAGSVELTGRDRERALEHLRKAQESIQATDDSVLARVHPRLPAHIRTYLRRSIEYQRLWYETGETEYATAGPMLQERWNRWYMETRDTWELPSR